MQKRTPAYEDIRCLIELSNFTFCPLNSVNLSRRSIYIFWQLNELVQSFLSRVPKTHRRATTIWWNLERAFRPMNANSEVVPAYETHLIDLVDQIWLSDPYYVASFANSHARFVLLASDERLGTHPEMKKIWDFAHISYPTERRKAVLNELQNLRIAPNAWGETRHQILKKSQMMLNVHQDEFPVMPPLRIAIAAAYQLPVISESVRIIPREYESLIFASIGTIPERVRNQLQDHNWLTQAGTHLYDSLCKKTNFCKEVLRALA